MRAAICLSEVTTESVSGSAAALLAMNQVYFLHCCLEFPPVIQQTGTDGNRHSSVSQRRSEFVVNRNWSCYMLPRLHMYINLNVTSS